MQEKVRVVGNLVQSGPRFERVAVVKHPHPSKGGPCGVCHIRAVAARWKAGGNRVRSGSLADRLRTPSAPYRRRGIRYPLAIILILMILAKLGGEDRPSGIADWVKGRQDRLCAALRLHRSTMPHHYTFRRILAQVVAPAELEALVQEFSRGLPGVGRSSLVSIDGKTVRGTIGADTPRGEHLLGANRPAEGIVLLQVDAGAKENEISIAPTQLQGLDLRGKVVTEATAEISAPTTLPTSMGARLPLGRLNVA